MTCLLATSTSTVTTQRCMCFTFTLVDAICVSPTSCALAARQECIFCRAHERHSKSNRKCHGEIATCDTLAHIVGHET